MALAWDASIDPNAIGYRCYYGTASGRYDHSVEAGSATTASVAGLSDAATYFFVVTAYNAAGAESQPSNEVAARAAGATPGEDPSASRSSLLNISTRANVQGGDQVLIGGFIVVGTSAKKITLRAIGPSLVSAGITQPLSDPVLDLFDATGALIASNDNWGTSPEEIDPALVPTDEHESVIVASLAPGAYTVVVRNADESSSGVAVFELYDLDPASSRVANLSSRGKVGLDDDVMIGGVNIGGDQATRVMVRAIGPSLSASGVANALGDPLLELHDGNGSLIVQNDNWRDQQEEQIASSGLAPQDERESAIVATLAPGTYTAVVRDASGASGIALIEVYNLEN